MHIMRNLLLSGLFLLITACDRHDPASLCLKFYAPYPDLVSDRARTPDRAAFLDAMVFYDEGDYAGAVAGLQEAIDKDPGNSAIRMYLASANLGAGDPYKAEMHLDFLENQDDRSFQDQVDWYNALCWLCQGDTARADKQAHYIVSRPHTYKKEAQELIDALKK